MAGEDVKCGSCVENVGNLVVPEVLLPPKMCFCAILLVGSNGPKLPDARMYGLLIEHNVSAAHLHGMAVAEPRQIWCHLQATAQICWHE